jgi:hypothetical protein
LAADGKAPWEEQVDVVVMVVAVASKITLQGRTTIRCTDRLVHQHIVVRVKVGAVNRINQRKNWAHARACLPSSLSMAMEEW